MNETFYYIDLFAGMGGFRRAMDDIGGKCAYSSEIDPRCRETYRRNYGDEPDGDITKVDEQNIPEHDLLCGGFPCQSFSIAGRKLGFSDPRGTLFFDILRIARAKMPSCLLLENVKHLSKHDGGETLKTIGDSLKNLGYNFSWKVLNSKDFGVPQSRERTIMVAALGGHFDFERVEVERKSRTIRDVMEDCSNPELDRSDYTILPRNMWRTQKSGLIFVGYRNKPSRKRGIRPGTEHLSRFHKQPNRIYHADGTHPTIPSQESAGRFWVYDDQKVRKLSVRECLMVQGFPASHILPDKESVAYRQIGNSVPPPMIKAVALEVMKQGLVSKR